MFGCTFSNPLLPVLPLSSRAFDLSSLSLFIVCKYSECCCYSWGGIALRENGKRGCRIDDNKKINLIFVTKTFFEFIFNNI